MSFLRYSKTAWNFFPVADAPIAVEASFDWRDFQTTDFNAQKIRMPLTLSNAVAKRQAEFLAGRLCARSALELSDNILTNVGLNEDRSPKWPDGIVGSITHTDRVAGAVVARRTDYLGLGFDFEWHIEQARAREIADSILTETDRSLEKELSGISFEYYLTLIFSLKESLYKALYPRAKKFMDFHDAEITALDGYDARMRLNRPVSADLGAGREFDAVHTYVDGLVKTLVYIRA